MATTLLAVLAVLGTAGTATAATDDCAKDVIADWYADGRVDRIYDLHCYRDAVKALPVDVRDYSSAKDDILRALLYAKQGETDPGDDGQGSGSGAGPGGGGTGTSGSGGEGTGSGSGETPRSGASSGQGSSAQVDTAGPSSIPVPLLVLAGLATLLLALGAAGYLTRRRSGPGGDEPATPA